MFAPKSNTQSSKPNNSIFGGGDLGFIQPKLNVGKSGDKYEVEADKAADQIVAKSKEPSSTFIAPSPTIQKQTEEDVQKQENENEIQQKPVVDKITPGVQLKVDPVLQKQSEEEIQAKEEEEVQTKEEEVQQKTEEESVQSKKDENSKESIEPIQAKKLEATPIIQKQVEEEVQTKEEEEIQEKEEEEVVQKQATSTGGDGSGIESSLSDSKGGGSSLNLGVQNEMESGFGADFGGVRVHNDDNAVQMNQELGSQAFTNGNDIYFNEGKYNPESDSGKHLLAHELTHTVQQGASPSGDSIQKSSIVQKEEAKEPAKPGQPTTTVDISNGFKLSKDWLEYIANSKEKKYDVSVKIGALYEGKISIKKLGKAAEGETQKFELASKKKRYLDVKGMEFLNPLKEAQVYPILVLNNFGEEQKTSGFLSVRKGADALTTNVLGVIDSINANLDKMGFLGLDKIKTGGLENKYENGGLNFKANELSVGVDGYIQASGSLGITNSAFTFDVTSTVSVAGLAEGEFNLKRDEKGELAGKATISADIANVNASLTVEYEKGSVTIQGTGKISSEKFSGELTLLVTDASKSKQMMHAALGVESLDAEKKAPAAPAKQVQKTSQNQVLAGWGTVEATITPWLQGKATIGIDNKGQVTIVGTISVPSEVNLMDQKGVKKDLFDFEIRAGYGIPLVGQVFLFANIGMFINAGFGPLVLKDVALTGTYSTDPSVLQNFGITGTLGINAFAILGLKAEAGVGVTLLGHDIKAGVALTAAAGIKAYAEATPMFEYKEQKSPQGGKVGESRLKGHFEAAAQLFLQLTGSLFYELDSPWWSPAPDGRTDYPLGEVQYPIGDSMGIGADMDWLVGSEEPPELKFSPVEFDPSKFTADVMADPPPKKMGKSEQKPKGKFDNKGGSGDQQKDPKATGNGKGLPPNNKKKEDLKNLPDNQKYLRGLDELSKLEKIDPKPSIGVVKAKMQKVKSKYGLQTVNIKNEKDGEVTIYVSHKKENNSKRLLKIKLMSNAERMKLLNAAMTDLRKRETKIVDKEGKTDEAKAKDLLLGWTKAHKIIESAKVVDGKTTWDYLIDIGDKSNTEKGKGKSGVEGDGIDKNNLDADGKKLVSDILAVKVPFTNESKETHNLDFEQKGKEIELFRKSKPVNVREHLVKIEAAIKKEEDKKEASEIIKSLAIIKRAYNLIESKINRIESLFLRKDETGKLTDKKKTNFSIEMGTEIKTQLAKIAKALVFVPEINEKGEFVKDTKQVRPPSEKVDFDTVPLTLSDGTKSIDGQKMTATLLSRIGPPGLVGSQPNSAGHSELYKILIENRRNVVAAHLLNHQLFGPGNKSKNLTPIPGPSNTRMNTSFENKVKDAVFKDNEVVSYIVTVNYDVTSVAGEKTVNDKIPEEKLIPNSISVEAKKIKPIEGKKGDDLKKAENWDKSKGESLGVTGITGIKGDIAFKGGKLTDLDRLAKFYPQIDRALATDPELTWDNFRKNYEKEIKKMIPKGDSVANSELSISIKQEFLKRQAELGETKKTGSPKSFEEIFAKAQNTMREMIASVDSTSRDIGGLKAQAKKRDTSFSGINSGINGILDKGKNDRSGAESVANSATFKIATNIKNLLKGLFEGLAGKELETKIKEKSDAIVKGLSPDYKRYLMRCWSHVNEGDSSNPVQETHDALLANLAQWNNNFNEKTKEESEADLKPIRSRADLFLTNNGATEKQKQNVSKKTKEAEARLSLRTGEPKTDIQKISKILQNEQDGLSDSTLEELIELESKTSSVDNYLVNKGVSNYGEMNLSNESRSIINRMFTFLKSKIIEVKNEKLTS